MKLKNLAAALGLGLSVVATSAVADPFVTGTASVTGFFSSYSASPTAIVADLTTIDVSAIAAAGGTTGDLAPDTFAVPSDFSIIPFVPGTIFSFNGFTFTLTSVSTIVPTAMTCAALPGGCSDDLAFDIAGTVTKIGFAPTLFTGTWTGNGTCNQSTVTPGSCLAGTKSGSWSASIVAAGTGVPEPGTLALMGLGLAGLALTRRRKSTKS